MKLFIALLVLCICRAEVSRNYEAEIQLWRQAVSKQQNVIELKQFSNEGQICKQSSCQYYYFLSSNSQLAAQPSTNLTVLLLSGLRGNDVLGPKVLLVAYGKLKAARIIYFPFANPSGLSMGTSQTHPGKIDVQNDFPIGSNTECNRTSAFKILQHLYLKYPIDLTVYLHDGPAAFSYSWNGKYDGDNSRTGDFGIHTDIAEMIRYEGEQEKQLDKVATGTNFEVNAGHAGNFVDWAYGASKNANFFSKKCQKQEITPYPELAMNGLTFSLGLGQSKSNQITSDKQISQIKRGVATLSRIISITDPKIDPKLFFDQLAVKLSGCKTGSVTKVQLFNEKGEVLSEKLTETLVKGDVLYGPQPTTNIPLPVNSLLSNAATYDIDFQCDNGWVSIGKTAFSKVRNFKQRGSISINKKQKDPSASITSSLEVKPLVTKSQQPAQDKGWSFYATAAVIVLVAFVIVWIVVGIRLGVKIQKQQRIKNFNEKFQTVEFVEDTQSFSNHFSDKDNDLPEITQIKQSSNQLETDQTHLNSS